MGFKLIFYNLLNSDFSDFGVSVVTWYLYQSYMLFGYYSIGHEALLNTPALNKETTNNRLTSYLPRLDETASQEILLGVKRCLLE